MPGCGRYQLPATGTALLIPRGLLCLVHAGGDDDCGFCLGTMRTETTGTVLEYCPYWDAMPGNENSGGWVDVGTQHSSRRRVNYRML